MLVYFSKMPFMCNAEHAAPPATGSTCQQQCTVTGRSSASLDNSSQTIRWPPDVDCAPQTSMITTLCLSQTLTLSCPLDQCLCVSTGTSLHNPMQLFCDQTYLLHFQETFNTFSIPSIFFLIFAIYSPSVISFPLHTCGSS